MKNRIAFLSEETIIQIAAGEIIENPASVIKELVENAIDAESSKISIEIKNNGRDLIKITDDGTGFDKQDLKIAFKRHSTSKIKNITELNRALSLGFRGEALSSIANVSEVTVISKRQDDLVGVIAEIDHNGDMIDVDEIVTNNGSTIICQNLFSNIPVRKKYLDSKNYEIHKTNDIVNRLVLSQPKISFEYKKDDRIILKTDKNSSSLNNIYSVLGRDISENLYFIDYSHKDFKIHGYISNNRLYRSNKNYQFLFVNNRSVIDRDISRIIEKQYFSLIPLNRYPVFIIYIDISPELVDVNIHPKKDIIKFTNINDLEDAFSNVISSELKPNIKINEIHSYSDEKKLDTVFNKFAEYETVNFEEKSDDILKYKDFTVKDNSTGIKMSDNILDDNNPNLIDICNNDDVIEESFIDTSTVNNLFPKGYRYIGNLFKQYLLLEDSSDMCLYILDQHAAHERINYERLVRDYKSNNISTQSLISGYILELTVNEFDQIIGLKENLNSIGLEIEEFGDNSIIIRAIPAYIENLNPETLISDLLNNSDFKSSIYDINPYELMRKACRASVKTGSNLTSLDVHKLISLLQDCEIPLTCPHGRPTIVKITKNELDKEFFRIQDDK